MTNDLVTVREVADTLRVSQHTVRKMIDQGVLVGLRVGPRGGSVRIKRTDFEQYLESCVITASKLPSRSWAL